MTYGTGGRDIRFYVESIFNRDMAVTITTAICTAITEVFITVWHRHMSCKLLAHSLAFVYVITGNIFKSQDKRSGVYSVPKPSELPCCSLPT